jgi:hypothetical protein
MSDSNQQRRRFFRINERIRLSFLEIDRFINPMDKDFPDPGGSELFNLMSSINSIENESQHILRAIHEQDRTVSNYLRTIDKRIQLLARMIVIHSPEMTGLGEQDVSLSESGLAFSNPKAMETDQWLAIKLMLMPEFSGIIATGKVVRCHQEEEHYIISVSLEKMSEADRHLLSKHIIQHQSRERRKELDLSS